MNKRGYYNNTLTERVHCHQPVPVLFSSPEKIRTGNENEMQCRSLLDKHPISHQCLLDIFSILPKPIFLSLTDGKNIPFLNENKREDNLDLTQKWFGLSSLIFATITHVLVLIAKVRRFVLILSNYFWITCDPIRYHVLPHK